MKIRSTFAGLYSLDKVYTCTLLVVVVVVVVYSLIIP